MYRLSEQPVSIILKEMNDFKPLTDRIGIYKVKEKFAVTDSVYEVGDLVALCGHGEDDQIIFIPYENYLRIRTEKMSEFLSGMKDNKECKVISILLSTFHSRFELCLPETEKIDEIRKKAINLNNEKEQQSKAYNYTLDGAAYSLIIFFPCIIAGLLAHGCGYLYFAIILYIISALILINFIKESITYKVKGNKQDDIFFKYVGMFREIDEQRKKDGLFITNEE